MFYHFYFNRLLLSVAILLMFGSPIRMNAQTITCGTQLTQSRISYELNRLQNPVARSVVGEVRRELSVLVHVILDRQGDGGITVAEINNLMSGANDAFEPIKMSFKVCEIDTIHNWNYRYIWSQDVSDAECQVLYYQPKVINIFLVDSILSGAAGYAYFPGGADIIVVKLGNSAVGTLIHELGHFFGLYHTFEDQFGLELSNGSNCATTGDFLCDTEADPDGDVDSTCNLISPLTDPIGDWYDPPVDNYMSYYDCGCRFTKEQYDRMYFEYTNNRNYLR